MENISSSPGMTSIGSRENNVPTIAPGTGESAPGELITGTGSISLTAHIAIGAEQATIQNDRHTITSQISSSLASAMPEGGVDFDNAEVSFSTFSKPFVESQLSKIETEIKYCDAKVEAITHLSKLAGVYQSSSTAGAAATETAEILPVSEFLVPSSETIQRLNKNLISLLNSPGLDKKSVKPHQESLSTNNLNIDSILEAAASQSDNQSEENNSILLDAPNSLSAALDQTRKTVIFLRENLDNITFEVEDEAPLHAHPHSSPAASISTQEREEQYSNDTFESADDFEVSEDSKLLDHVQPPSTSHSSDSEVPETNDVS